MPSRDFTNTERRRSTGWPGFLAIFALLAVASTAWGQTAHPLGVTATVNSGFYSPTGVAVDSRGNVFVADTMNNAVKEIVAVNGAVSASSTVISVGGLFSNPIGVAVDGSGNVFVGEYSTYSAVKEIVATNGAVSASSGVITVGSGFSYVYGVAVDSRGNVFVAARDANAVREVVAVNGLVSPSSSVITVGSGFSNPTGVAVDGSGNVFVADYQNSAVKEIVAVSGTVSASSTVITVGSGISPFGVALDGNGNVFFTDDNTNTVKEIVAVNGAVSASSSVITLASGFSYPNGVVVDGNGNVFVADSSDNAVKEITSVARFAATPVGVTSTPIPISFNFDSAGTLAATPYVVLTQGAQNLDFQAASTQPSNACLTAHTYNPGDVCTVNVAFTPTKPYQRIGAVQLMGSGGTPIATFPLVGTGLGPQVIFPGNSAATRLPSGSGFNNPGGVAVDSSGDVFVADTYHNAVKEIVALNGAISASSPVITLGAGFSFPSGVAVDGSGNVFVADNSNYAVKEIVAVNGAVSAGSQVITLPGSYTYPYAVAVDGSGNVFVGDSVDNAVKEIVAVNGAVSSSSPVLSVGSGFSYPTGVAVDGSGNVFVVDRNNQAVKEIVAVDGVVSGNSEVITVSTGFLLAYGVAVDGSGNLFVAASGNNTVKEILAVNGVVPANPQVITVSGGFSFPAGVAVDASGNVFVADQSNNAAKEVDRSDPPTLTFASTAVGSTSSDSPQSVLFQNGGNATLTAVSPGLTFSGTSFAQVAGSGNPADCSASFSLTPGQMCNLSFSFTPQSNGPLTGSATFTDNALNASPSVSQAIQLAGNGIAAASISANTGTTPQSTNISTTFTYALAVTVKDAGSNPLPNASVVFTAPASGASGTFSNNSNTITETTNSNGIATTSVFTANSIGGSYNVTAVAGAVQTSFSLTNIAPQNVTITVPAGISFTLNSVNYTGTQTVSLNPGPYTLSTTSPQSTGSGTQAAFVSWSDSGAMSHSITVASSPLSITGTFKTQYQLTTMAGTGGSVTPMSGAFYDAGTVVNISAAPNANYVFMSWTGPAASTTAAATTVTMSAPESVTANFRSSTTQASASYLALDTTTQGNWTSPYGADGYFIANDASKAPAYATVSFTGESTWTWQSPSSDPRALQTYSGSSTRIASTYYTSGTFNIDVNITDGNMHKVALYLLDFDSTSRSETISILDAGTSAVLSTQSFAHFQNGEYASWNVTGHVRIQVTQTGGVSSAVSGVFFSTTSLAPPVISQVMASNITNTSATITWTTDQASSSQVNYGTTTSYGSSSTLDSTLVTSHSVTLTGLTSGTPYDYAVLSTGSTGVAAQASNFTFTTTSVPTGSASAVYNGMDAATQGTWTGTYGGDGYIIANDVTNPPRYATTSITGASTWTFQSPSTDPRALQTSSGASTRIASTYYAGGTFNINVNLTDGAIHKVALYLLDWDTTSRTETISVLDAGTNAVLSTQYFAHFQNGVYASWNITGNVIIRVTATGGVSSAVSGIFFDSSSSAAPPVISQVTTASVTVSVATITWKTDQPSTSQVTYGTTTAYGTSTTLDPTLVTNHSVTINGLTPGTPYNYEVMSKNQGGLSSKSPNNTFTTSTTSNNATYNGTDTVTQGTWTGKYGANGYIIAGDIADPPAYANVGFTGDSTWTWTSASSDPRALQISSGASSRIASTYYTGGTFNINVNFTDGGTHKVALYLLDWDSTSRAETISILDAATQSVLNTQSFSQFQNGVWASWNITGNVIIQVTQTGGISSAVSGIFFGPI